MSPLVCRGREKGRQEAAACAARASQRTRRGCSPRAGPSISASPERLTAAANRSSLAQYVLRKQEGEKEARKASSEHGAQRSACGCSQRPAVRSGPSTARSPSRADARLGAWSAESHRGLQPSAEPRCVRQGTSPSAAAREARAAPPKASATPAHNIYRALEEEEEEEAALRRFAGSEPGNPGETLQSCGCSPRLCLQGLPPGAAPRSHVRGACWKRTYSLRCATQHPGPGRAACAEQPWQPREHAQASALKLLLSSEKNSYPSLLLPTTTQVTATACSLSFPRRCCSGPGRLVLPCVYTVVTISQEEKLVRSQFQGPLCSALGGAEGSAAEPPVPWHPAGLLEETGLPGP